MDMLVRRYLVGAELVAVALVAVLLARASAVLISGRMATSTMVMAMVPTLAPPVRFADVASGTGFGATKPLEGILSRNIFCSTCPAIGGRTGVVIVPASPRKSLPTALPLALIAVMYVPPPG